MFNDNVTNVIRKWNPFAHCHFHISLTHYYKLLRSNNLQLHIPHIKKPYALSLKPYALCLMPYALSLTPYALRLTPYALCLTPYASPILNQCGLSQSENGEIESSNRSDRYKNTLRSVVRIIGVIHLRLVAC
jgi:hypothetical protein